MNILISDFNSIMKNDKFVEYIKNQISNKSALFIPSVLEMVDKTSKYINDIIRVFKEYGIEFDIVNHFTDKPYSKSYLTDINKYGLIFLMGGRTLEQKETLSKYNIKETLNGYNGVVIGMSAGALNMCEDSILTPGDGDVNETLKFKGLGLVKLTVDVHFILSDINHLKHLENVGKKVYCIADDGAIIENNGNLLMIGDVYLYKGNKRIIKI